MTSITVLRTVADATRALAALEARADEVRAELALLNRDLAAAEQDLSRSEAARLLEANERLVISAMNADSVAAAVSGKLDELVRVSQHDALTDTPNRALMLDRIDGAIAQARRHRTRFAIFFIDLDGFKAINDAFGHAVGDRVLQLVARRLKAAVRDSDTVSRHGGDEFLVLLTDIAHTSDAAVVAAKMLRALAASCQLGDDRPSLSASLGIAVYPDDGQEAMLLVERADAAMYRAKNGRPGSFVFHGSDAPAAEPALLPARP